MTTEAQAKFRLEQQLLDEHRTPGERRRFAAWFAMAGAGALGVLLSGCVFMLALFSLVHGCFGLAIATLGTSWSILICGVRMSIRADRRDLERIRGALANTAFLEMGRAEVEDLVAPDALARRIDALAKPSSAIVTAKEADETGCEHDVPWDHPCAACSAIDRAVLRCVRGCGRPATRAAYCERCYPEPTAALDQPVLQLRLMVNMCPCEHQYADYTDVTGWYYRCIRPGCGSRLSRQAYTGWLQAKCQHARRRTEGGIVSCQDCHVVFENWHDFGTYWEA